MTAALDSWTPEAVEALLERLTAALQTPAGDPETDDGVEEAENAFIRREYADCSLWLQVIGF